MTLKHSNSMFQLQVTLATIFLGRLFVNNIKACAIPMLLKFFQSKATNTTTANDTANQPSAKKSISRNVTARKDPT